MCMVVDLCVVSVRIAVEQNSYGGTRTYSVSPWCADTRAYTFSFTYIYFIRTWFLCVQFWTKGMVLLHSL